MMSPAPRALQCLLSLVMAGAAGFAATPPAGLGLSAGPGGTVLRAGRPCRGIGVNYFDCFLRTLKDGGDTSYAAGFAALWVYDFPRQAEWNVTATNARARQLDAVAAANRPETP